MYTQAKLQVHLTGTRTQDLIFTLFGDYIVQRGGMIWIGALIELLDLLGASAQAVRSAASRMVSSGWLESEKQGRKSYYSLTPKGINLLSKGGQQIFHPPQDQWDGYWYMVTYSFTTEQDRIRHRLRRRLSWVGFGQLASSVWISPRNKQSELEEIVADLDICENIDYFRTTLLLCSQDSPIVKRCWELDELNQDYRLFIDTYQEPCNQDRQNIENISPDYAFTRRFWLIHQYRYFPFRDPYLPLELLPEDWQGLAAFELFQAYHDLLRHKAHSFVNQVLVLDSQ